MGRVGMNECSAVVDTVSDVIIDLEKGSLAITTIVRLVAALSVFDQFKPFKKSNILPEFIVFLDDSTL